MELITSALLIVSGLIVGGSLALMKTRRFSRQLSASIERWMRECEHERITSAQFMALAEERKGLIEKHEKSIGDLQAQNTELQKFIGVFETKQSTLEIKLKENEKEADERRQKALFEFDHLARKILDEKTKNFNEVSQKTLDGLIYPLKEKLKSFQEQIETTHKEDLRDRSALQQQIRSIIEAGKELKNSSDSLTKALRGDSKTQGKWGELVLEKVLEASGLRKGHEFTTQMSYSGEMGEKLLPDVALHLSNEKSVFIDAKVSLTHYDKYVSATDESATAFAENALVNSFCERIKELSKKNYQAIPNVETLDFVIMFTPIESALAVVIQYYEREYSETLFEYAWKKGVIVASPSTLMPVLRTIDLCWKAEFQRKNALEIAEEGGKLYDKFVIFLTKLEKVGNSIEKSRELFEETKRSLSEGTGNLIGKTEHIRKLLKKERKVPAEYFNHDPELSKS